MTVPVCVIDGIVMVPACVIDGALKEYLRPTRREIRCKGITSSSLGYYYLKCGAV